MAALWKFKPSPLTSINIKIKKMKAIIFSITVFTVSIFFSCNNNTPETDASWKAYCAAYNVNTDTPTEEQETYFLDCWCGSVEEEEALSNK